MKLVDILARELRVWPAKAEYCWQDYDRGVRFYGAGIGDFIASELSCEFRARGNTVTHAVTRAQWQSAVDALKAPPIQIIGDLPKPGWIAPEKTADLIDNGWLESLALHCQKAGRVYRLPPIGSTVRIDKGDRVVWDSAEMFIGVDVTLVSTFMTGDTQMVAVEHPVEKVCHCFRADMVRALEQIAAIERESAIKAFMRIGDIYYCDAEKLYDAGARLPQVSKGEQ